MLNCIKNIIRRLNCDEVVVNFTTKRLNFDNVLKF